MRLLMVKGPSTPELVERSRGGDREAFDELVTRHETRLRESVERWARFRLSGRVDVEDVLQETFLRAYGSLDRFDARGEDSGDLFFRWLCGIAKRALGDLLRKGAIRENPVSTIERAGSEPSHGREIQRQERLDRFERALRELPDDYRKVLVLSRFEGLSAEEIAKRLGRSSNAVYHLISRALRALREKFGDTESFHLPRRNPGGTGGGDVE